MNSKMSVLARACLGVLLSTVLGGCDITHSETYESNSLKHEALSPQLNPLKESAEHPVLGHKLTEVAGRAPLPVLQDTEVLTLQDESLQYAGRYYTQLSCQEALVDCGRGSAEYILNLLPDGSAHHIVATFGKLRPGHGQDAAESRLYRKDRWTVDQVKKELVIHLAEGINIYYRVDPKQNLIMNLYKTLHSNDQQAIHDFAQLHPLPQHPYKMIRDSVSF